MNPSGSKVSTWLTPSDQTAVLDYTPWVGDRALASLALMSPEQLQTTGALRHCVVDAGDRHISKGAGFALERVRNMVAKQWMCKARILHDRVMDDRGDTTLVPRQPSDSIPPPSEEMLKEVPGALEAWRGLASLSLKACAVRGPKVTIAPHKVAEFQGAPLDISRDLDALQAAHTESYEDMLAHMAMAEITERAEVEEKAHDDPRTPGTEQPSGPTTDLVTFESVEALKRDVQIKYEVPAMQDKHVTILVDEGFKQVFLLAKSDNHIVKAGTLLGAYGGGSVVDKNPSNPGVVPWSLPKGDRTLVQIVGPDSDEERKAKPVSTLYASVKPLEKKAVQDRGCEGASGGGSGDGRGWHSWHVGGPQVAARPA